MCGRFHMMTDEDVEEIQQIVQEINRRFAGKPELAQMKTGEIYPTNIVPVIANSKSFQPKPFLMQWGFSGFGEKKQPIINARCETAMERPMFRKPLMGRRCLIPATHYYEWHKQDGRRVKYAIKTVEPMIYLAGMYRYEADKPLPMFTILTREAAEDIQFVHDRMPVILPHDMAMGWLEPGADVQGLMRQADERVIARAV